MRAIGHGEHRHRMAEAVAKLPRVLRRSWLAIFARLERLKPPRIATIQRWSGKSNPRVVERIDSIVHDRRQMLIARNMERKRLPHLCDCSIPLTLRPAVGVVISDEPPLIPVMRRHRGENR